MLNAYKCDALDRAATLAVRRARLPRHHQPRAHSPAAAASHRRPPASLHRRVAHLRSRC